MVTGSTFGLNQNLSGSNHSLEVEARNGGTVMNMTVTGSTFTGAPGNLINVTGQTATTMDVIIGGATATPGTAPGNALTNNHPGNIVGGGGMTLATQGSMTFHLLGNSMRDANGAALTLQKASAGTLLSGFMSNNTIGVTGVVDSGSKTANAIFASYAGAGTASVTFTNNVIRNWHGNGGMFFDNTGGTYTANFSIKGNTIAEPGAGSFCDLCLTNGANLSSDKVNVCAEIGGATAGEKNNFGGPTGRADIVLVSSGSTTGHTYSLPGYGGTIHDFAAINAFVASHNTIIAGSTLTYQSSDDNGAGGLGFVGGAACGTPISMYKPEANGQGDLARTEKVYGKSGDLLSRFINNGGEIASIFDLNRGTTVLRSQSGSVRQPRDLGAISGVANLNAGAAAPSQSIFARAETILRAPSSLAANVRFLANQVDDVLTPTVTAAGPSSSRNKSQSESLSPTHRQGSSPRVSESIQRSESRNQRSEVRVQKSDVRANHARRSLRTNRSTTGMSPMPVSGGTFPINGTGSGFSLPNGKTITIKFSVTLNNPPNLSGVPPATPQVSSQGTLSGAFPGNPIVTDDPGTIAANDPTVTLVDLFDTTTTLGAVPAAGSWNVGQSVRRLMERRTVSYVHGHRCLKSAGESDPGYRQRDFQGQRNCDFGMQRRRLKFSSGAMRDDVRLRSAQRHRGLQRRRKL